MRRHCKKYGCDFLFVDLNFILDIRPFMLLEFSWSWN